MVTIVIASTAIGLLAVTFVLVAVMILPKRKHGATYSGGKESGGSPSATATKSTQTP
jgi:hypothetical protein